MRLSFFRAPHLSLADARVLGEIREARGMFADDPVAVENTVLIERFEARAWVAWVDRGLGPQLYTTNDGDVALGEALGVEI